MDHELPLDSSGSSSLSADSNPYFPGPWRAWPEIIAGTHSVHSPAAPKTTPFPEEAGCSLPRKGLSCQGRSTVSTAWVQFPPDSSFCYKHNKSERDRWQDLIHFYQMFLGCEYKTENKAKEREVEPPRGGRGGLWIPMDQTVASVWTTRGPLLLVRRDGVWRGFCLHMTPSPRNTRRQDTRH